MARANNDVVARAFRDGVKARGNNTVCDGDKVWLHGNKIAWRDPESGMVWVSFCTWPTPTTRARIDAILGALGVRDMGFRCKRDGTLWLNGVEVGTGRRFPVCGPLTAIAMRMEAQAKIAA